MTSTCALPPRRSCTRFSRREASLLDMVSLMQNGRSKSHSFAACLFPEAFDGLKRASFGLRYPLENHGEAHKADHGVKPEYPRRTEALVQQGKCIGQDKARAPQNRGSDRHPRRADLVG